MPFYLSVEMGLLREMEVWDCRFLEGEEEGEEGEEGKDPRTDSQLSHLNRGQKLKSKRIACKFLLFKAFAKPSVKSSDVKQDLYLAMEKIKNKKI